MKNPVMYIFVNKGLGMSTGKTAAQVGHAVGRSLRDAIVAAVSSSWVSSEAKRYFDVGETKIVLEVRDTEHLLAAERYLKEHGIATYLVIDEGRTEVPPLSYTAMATEIVDKADENVQFALSSFKTYKDPKPAEVIEDRPRLKFW